MISLMKIGGAVVVTLSVVVHWLQDQFIHPLAEWWIDTVLGTWEQSMKSIVRESFAKTTRAINGFCSFAVAILPVNRSHHKSLSTTLQRSQAWHSWWSEERPSTFNAMLEIDRQKKAGTAQRYPPSSARGGNQPSMTRLQSVGWQLRRLMRGIAAVLRWIPIVKRVVPTVSADESPRVRGGVQRKRRVQCTGSELFDRQSGCGIEEGPAAGRGFIDDMRLKCELGITRLCLGIAWLVRKLVLMPDDAPARGQSTAPHQAAPHSARRGSYRAPAGPLNPGGTGPSSAFDNDGVLADAEDFDADGFVQTPSSQRRSSSFSEYESQTRGHHVWTAYDVIKQAGYPVERHRGIRTDDDYRMEMVRIYNKDAKDAVFFMHGVLDTSLGWVSNGVAGSSAFAAYDAGFDVWLGNSRANPPFEHEDKDMMKQKYWQFSVNELGVMDIKAQIQWIHNVKCDELRGRVPTTTAASALQMHGAGVGYDVMEDRPRRSSSETALDTLTSKPCAEPSLRSVRPRPLNLKSASATAESAPPSKNPLLSSDSSSLLSHPLSENPLMSRQPHFSIPPTKQLPRSSAVAVARSTASPPRLLRKVSFGANQTGDSSNAAEAAANESPGASHPLKKRKQQYNSSLSEPEFDQVSAAAPAAQRCCHAATEIEEEPQQQQMLFLPDPEVMRLRRHPRHASPQEGGQQLPPAAAAAEAAEMLCQPDRSPESPPARVPEPDSLAEERMTPDRCSVGGVETPGERASSGMESSQIPHGLLFPSLEAEGEPHTSPDAQPRAEGGHSASSSRLLEAKVAGPVEDSQPYRLRAVGHSLGGASLLIYAVMQRRKKLPHYITRLVLLTPAGFLKTNPIPWYVWPLAKPAPWVLRQIKRVFPGFGSGCYVPSSLLRYFTFKILVDLQQIPALNELTLAGVRMLLNGDKSQWDKALSMPHFNAAEMPAFSFETACHLVQWCNSGKFTLYDYGTPEANAQHYEGDTEPINIAANYKLLDMPVDICAGRGDGIIAKENVLLHYEAMRLASCEVSYKEFDFGHLDFTFAVKDDLRHYLLSRLKEDRFGLP